MKDERPTKRITDYRGRGVRPTNERWQHVVEHAEMAGQLSKLRATLRRPERVLLSRLDTNVHLYYRCFENTPVTKMEAQSEPQHRTQVKKYLMVAVKDLEDDAFVITSFFTSEIRGGAEVWAK
jgi:hypothetical protein